MTTMYAVKGWSLSTGMMTIGSWFAERDKAEEWLRQEVNNNPEIYSGHPERTPEIIPKDLDEIGGERT